MNTDQEPMTDPAKLADTVREHLPTDYLGPDPNDMDGEKWGQHPEALAALDALVARLGEAQARVAELSDPAARHKEQLRLLVAQEEEIARKGLAVPKNLREQIAYHQRHREVFLLRADRGSPTGTGVGDRQDGGADTDTTPPGRRHRMANDSSHCRYCGAHFDWWSHKPCSAPAAEQEDA